MKNAAPKPMTADIIDHNKNITAIAEFEVENNPKNKPEIVETTTDQTKIILVFIRSPKVKSILDNKDAFSIVNEQIVSGGNNNFRMLPVSLQRKAQHQ